MGDTLRLVEGFSVPMTEVETAGHCVQPLQDINISTPDQIFPLVAS